MKKTEYLKLFKWCDPSESDSTCTTQNSVPLIPLQGEDLENMIKLLDNVMPAPVGMLCSVKHFKAILKNLQKDQIIDNKINYFGIEIAIKKWLRKPLIFYDKLSFQIAKTPLIGHVVLDPTTYIK